MKAEDINKILLCQIRDRLATWLPGGHYDADEYVVLNPTRADRKAGSFRINASTCKWADFATGDKGGDPISLFAYVKRISNGDAIKELSAQLGQPVRSKSSTPDFRHSRHGDPSQTWTYRGKDGSVLGYICRYETEEGKQICPVTLVDGKWMFKGFKEPRPLYGLEIVGKFDTILIVEGEKTADAARAILGSDTKIGVVTWSGGAKAVKKTDWQPLKGKRIAIFPDADEPGFVAAEQIAEIVTAFAVRTVIVSPPKDVPKGWDLADAEDWDKERLLGWIKNQQQERSPAKIPKQTPPPKTPDKPKSASINRYYMPWGYEGSNYIYYSFLKNQIVALKPSEHTRKNLIELAPISFWENEFGVKKDYDSVAENLMLRCMERGPFTYDLVRGRGAWIEKGSYVLHLGDRLIVDGAVKGFQEHDSRFIYERSFPLEADVIPEPATVDECRKFVALCGRLQWEKPIYGEILAGWTLVALVAGALRWRPHLWVTGESGAGKSWVMDNILKPILGEVCLFVQASTTEAALRQELQGDSIPVMFDEAEGGKNNVDRIQRIMELVRSASSNNGAQILKGSASGEAQKYLIRSCFCFASISNGVKDHADKTRVVVLSLRAGNAQDDWNETKRQYGEIMTRDFCRRLRARAYKMASVIRASAEILSEEASKEVGSQRIGDQIGASLAGLWAMMSDRVITKEQAFELIQSRDLSDFIDVKDEKDQDQCLRYLLQRRARVNKSTGGSVDVPIGELLVIAGEVRSGEVTVADADRALEYMGIKVSRSKTHIFIAKKHAELARIYAETNWQAWDVTMRRLPGAKGDEEAKDFNGQRVRVIALPFENVIGQEYGTRKTGSPETLV